MAGTPLLSGLVWSDAGFELLAEERSREFARDLASSIPIDVISACSGGFCGLESLVGSLELVPELWVLLIAASSVRCCVGQTRLVSDFLSALAGSVDILDRLTILGWLDHNDHNLSCQVICDGSIITAEHVFELGQDSSAIAHPNWIKQRQVRSGRNGNYWARLRTQWKAKVKLGWMVKK